MNLCKVTVTVLAGFFLGVLLSHVPKVKANPQTEGRVHVYIEPVMVLDTQKGTAANPPGVIIAGISCIAKPETILGKRYPDAAVCYVATTLATHN